MIDKKPGDKSRSVYDAYDVFEPHSPTLHDTPPTRTTQVLGPDGNPVSLDVPRRKIGFFLQKKEHSGD